MTYYANTDITPFTPQYLHATPWDDPEIYKRLRPSATSPKLKRPRSSSTAKTTAASPSPMPTNYGRRWKIAAYP